eukprot:scaffold241535_cov23-Tisochrysis_lutea.AAC.1
MAALHWHALEKALALASEAPVSEHWHAFEKALALALGALALIQGFWHWLYTAAWTAVLTHEHAAFAHIQEQLPVFTRMWRASSESLYFVVSLCSYCSWDTISWPWHDQPTVAGHVLVMYANDLGSEQYGSIWDELGVVAYHVVSSVGSLTYKGQRRTYAADGQPGKTTLEMYQLPLLEYKAAALRAAYN